MNAFPTKRIRQSLFTGLKYEHVYTADERKEYFNRVTDGENPAKVMSEIDKKLTEDDWVLITED